MGNKCNTEMKVLTFYDGDAEAIDALADTLLSRQHIAHAPAVLQVRTHLFAVRAGGCRKVWRSQRGVSGPPEDIALSSAPQGRL